MITIKDEKIEIVKLKFPDNVRIRPGKLIGPTDNPNVILREIIDNAIDELFGSSIADTIYIDIPTDPEEEYYMVSDNGRGIPIVMDEEENVTKCELAIATLDAGSKFSKNINKIATGLNGVGSSCCNALSEKFVILSKVTEDNYKSSIKEVEEFYPDNKDKECFYYLVYERGIKLKESVAILEDIEKEFGVQIHSGMSTVVFFRPDSQIFHSIKARYSTENLRYVRLVMDKFYNKKVNIYIGNVLVTDEFVFNKYRFQKSIDIEDYTGKVKSAKFLIHFNLLPNPDRVRVTGSVNSLPVHGGIHIRMARDGYVEALKNYFDINHDYIFYGIEMDIIVIAGEVDFSSQTKEHLVRLDGLLSHEVAPILRREFTKIIKANEDDFRVQVERLNELAASLEEISAINKVKEMVVVAGDSGTRVRSKIPKSVKDASTNDRKSAELFICFPGDEKIKTYNSGELTFLELIDGLSKGKEYYTISTSPSFELKPSKIVSAGKTGTSKELVKIILDNGKSFRCTPNHLMIMRDGVEIRADELKVGDPLMPCYGGGKVKSTGYKVTKVEFIELEEEIDVYCLNVDSEYHNFPLEAGVFAHNCEGKSAGGTIVKARDRIHQAVIELRGVPMNAINSNLEELLENEEMNNIISAIGVGVNEYHDLSNPRYGKIIIATDADPDGGRIASMILGMIAKKMTFLIERGFVYILKTALYRQGDKFIYSDEEHLLDRSKPFKRYKGLGEINTDEAKIMITNPDTRKLVQITLDNVAEAIEILTSRDARRDLMINSGILVDRYRVGLHI